MHIFTKYQDSVQELTFTSEIEKYLVRIDLFRSKEYTTWLAETVTIALFLYSMSKKSSNWICLTN